MIKQGLGALALGVATAVAQAANPLFPALFTADPAAIVDNGRVSTLR